MRKNAVTVAMIFMAAALLMGAKGCSNCEKATAAAEAVCAASGQDSEACTRARAAASEACKPDTEPTPPPTPPPAHSCAEVLCPPDKPLCAETPEGPTCYKPTPTCPATCPEGQECKDPAVGCVVKPTPPPPPSGCVIPDADDPAWGEPVSVDKRPALMYQPYKRAIEKVGNRCGYVSADESKQMETLRLIADALRADGVCAAQSADSVSIKAPDGFYEEWHAVYFGNGCIIDGPNAYKNAWPYGGSTTPPPSDKCPAEPCPLRTYEDGKPHWEFKAKPHTMGNADSTPVNLAQCDFCKAVGLGCLNEDCSIPRCSCPCRPDGHADRVAVENWLLEGGPVREGRNGQDCTPNNTDNPYAFLNGTGNCRICNTPRTVCSPWM